MSIIFKPSTLYMKPNNESVDITNGIDFSFNFKGYKLTKAIGKIYHKDINSEWSSIGTPFDFFTSGIYYNNQTITKHITTTDTQWTALNSYLDATCGWSVDVYGESFSIVNPTQSNTFTLNIAGLNTGDQIYSSVAYQNSNLLYIGVEGNVGKLWTTREGALQNSTANVVVLNDITGTTLNPMEQSITIPFIPLIAKTLTVSASQSDVTQGAINKPNPTFNGAWSSSPSPIIESWVAYLYDSHGNLIEQSDVLYNANLTYTFKALFLNLFVQDGISYYGSYSVRFIATDVNKYQYKSNLLTLLVAYETPLIDYTPIVTNNKCDSSIKVDWRGAISNYGVTTGSPSILSNYLTNNRYGVELHANDTLTYNINMPSLQLPTFIFRPTSNSFTGRIAKFSKSGVQDLEIHYDSTLHTFLYQVYRYVDGTREKIYEENFGTITSLQTTHIYLIGVYNENLYVRDLGENTYQGSVVS